MGRVLWIATIFCLLTRVAAAIPIALPPPPGDQCRAAIGAAERGHGIPPQLLAAIGLVESGKRNPDTGLRDPWPWTINAEGQGAWFDTKAEALAAVRALQARGVRSIDVGCMQVNLMHHPAAFASLELAFEPAVNAEYAARFLSDLHDQSGDWMKAAAAYHSSNPAEGDPYAAKVAAIWPEEQRRAGLAPTAFGAIKPVFNGITVPFSARQPPRMLMLPAAAGGTAPAAVGAVVGHGLDFYRAAPLRLAARNPVLPRIPGRAALR